MRSIIVFAGLVLAAAGLFARYVERSEPQAAASRPAVAASAVASAPAGRSLTVPRDGRGHFQVEARVDGRRVGFMVDTGASAIALTERDARRLGIHPASNDFTVRVRTANGVVKAAPVTLNSVDVGGLVVRDVQALVVAGTGLSENLLGLSYLTRLKRFEYAKGRLVLEN